jgi:hypothetical protein
LKHGGSRATVIMDEEMVHPGPNSSGKCSLENKRALKECFLN